MKRSLLLCLATALLAGCGAPEKMSTDSALPAFYNETIASDAVLTGQWQQAQRSLATDPIYINAATSETPSYLPADPKAYSVEPHGVKVSGVPDAEWSSLPASIQKALIAQNVHGNPTGVYFTMSCNCYVHGETNLGRQPHVYVAASGASRLAMYEFENVILYQLGYNVSGR